MIKIVKISIFFNWRKHLLLILLSSSNFVIHILNMNFQYSSSIPKIFYFVEKLKISLQMSTILSTFIMHFHYGFKELLGCLSCSRYKSYSLVLELLFQQFSGSLCWRWQCGVEGGFKTYAFLEGCWRRGRGGYLYGGFGIFLEGFLVWFWNFLVLFGRVLVFVLMFIVNIFLRGIVYCYTAILIYISTIICLYIYSDVGIDRYTDNWITQTLSYCMEISIWNIWNIVRVKYHRHFNLLYCLRIVFHHWTITAKRKSLIMRVS